MLTVEIPWETDNVPRLEKSLAEAESHRKDKRFDAAISLLNDAKRELDSRPSLNESATELRQAIAIALARYEPERLTYVTEVERIRAQEASARQAEAARQQQLAKERADAAAAEQKRRDDAKAAADRAAALAAQAEAARRQAEADRLKVLSPEQIVALHEASVVLIKGATGNGTGFVVAPGVVVTNFHVIEGSTLGELEVYFPGAKPPSKLPTRVTSVRLTDRVRDLAFLSVETSLKPLPVSTTHEFRRGQSVTVIGNPGVGVDLVLENAVSVGVLSTKAEFRGQSFYQVSIGINPGNSGGPCFDSRGEVIGVVTMKASKQEGIAFCVPASDVRSALLAQARVTAAEARRVSSNHDATAVVSRLDRVGDVYATTMELYSTSMKRAIDAGLTVDVGLRTARDKVGETVLVLDQTMMAGMESISRQVARDAQVPEGVRTKIAELWSNYSELKSYVSNPRGTYLTYSAKSRELRDQRTRLMGALRLLLDIPEGN